MTSLAGSKLTNTVKNEIIKVKSCGIVFDHARRLVSWLCLRHFDYYQVVQKDL
jgi:hypothetical protein